MNSFSLLLTFMSVVTAHGWVSSPPSKNEMAFNHFQEGMPDSLRYEPQTSYWGNNAGNMLHGEGYSCGAKEAAYTQGLKTWQNWYDEAKVDIPILTPGENITLHINITADHGGQAWFTISCDDTINETTNWTYLNRSMNDRSHHFMPSNPEIYAWATSEAATTMNKKVTGTWDVPKDFNCTDGRVVGRWLWKTGSTCNDDKNVGRKTKKFVLKEFGKIVNDFGKDHFVKLTCEVAPETFISCFDFIVAGSHPTPPNPPKPPHPKVPTCCFTKWGDDTTCGGYTGKGGKCNTDYTKKCNSALQCGKKLRTEENTEKAPESS